MDSEGRSLALLVVALSALFLFEPCPLVQADEDVERPWAEREAPQHDYWNRPLQDDFTALLARMESGQVRLDTSDELNYLRGLLEALKIPVASQTLVFSTTSLQLRLISPRNPRAIYFNENVSVGFIPGGRFEVISVDPALGGIFYIFDLPRDGGQPRVERSTRCMNCHAKPEIGSIPGMVIKSVLPGQRGGSLDSFRRDETGHSIPLSERFGGWYLTGAEAVESHWGNQVGAPSPEGTRTTRLVPGEQFDFSRYPVPTSDLLAHLLHEHQAGFINRCIEANYRVRSYLYEANGRRLAASHLLESRNQARELVRYLLFADEASLPEGGIAGDPVYREQFGQFRKATRDGLSLRDFDLETRLFKHRCSYMIYSHAFQGLEPAFKQLVYRNLGEALDPSGGHPDGAHLPRGEKEAIRKILRETLEDLPQGW